MRLYEFTNPTKYLLPEIDAADLLKQSENFLIDDTTDDAKRHLKKKPESKNSDSYDRMAHSAVISAAPIGAFAAPAYSSHTLKLVSVSICTR